MRWLGVGNFATPEVNHGLDDETLNRIPVYYFRKAAVDQDAQNPQSENLQSSDTTTSQNILSLSSEEGSCIICLADYEVDQELKVLPCHHHFHKSCIDEWLHIQKTCPLCVQEVQYPDNANMTAQSC